MRCANCNPCPRKSIVWVCTHNALAIASTSRSWPHFVRSVALILLNVVRTSCNKYSQSSRGWIIEDKRTNWSFDAETTVCVTRHLIIPRKISIFSLFLHHCHLCTLSIFSWAWNRNFPVTVDAIKMLYHSSLENRGKGIQARICRKIFGSIFRRTWCK